MANIVHLLEEKLGYPPLEKVDPNTQETNMENYGGPVRLKLAQAAIPAVLEALSKYFMRKSPLQNLYSPEGTTNWLDAIFRTQRPAAVQKIAEYSGASTEETEAEMERIAGVAIAIFQDKFSDKASQKDIADYLGSQRNNFLTRLPASMQFGELLGDDTIDDRTHKMQGPISSLVHKIQDSFSGATKDSAD